MFYTLGCKVNQYETEVMMNQFLNNGFNIVDDTDCADIFIINSCTVTQESDKKATQFVRRIKRKNPFAVVAITGCFPQAFPEKVRDIEQIDIIIGSNNKTKLVEHVIHFVNSSHPERIFDVVHNTDETSFEKMSTPSFSKNTRAFVKIQDGCDKYCTYCIIPTARGGIRSKSVDDLKQEIKIISSNGYKEIVLVGINLSLYGVDIGSSLLEAIKVCASVDGIERVRLSSLEPELLTEEDLVGMSEIPEFCPQFHLSLQSGCDRTLKRMNRRYNTAEYYELVKRIRSIFDNSSITTDVMVGFPGEDQHEFEQSLEFCKKVDFLKAHVFSYSIRPGTPAANMPNQVSQSEKKVRNRILTQATDISRKNILNAHVGKKLQVLFESYDNGFNKGLAKNYCPVWLACDENLNGKILEVKVTEAFDDYCVAVIV